MTNTLKQRLITTFFLLVIIRLGIFLPIPGIDHDAFYNTVKSNQIIGFLNIFSGGGFSTIGVFAFGIVPYINASIIMQILVKILPNLKKIQEEEGEAGRQKINQITRLLACIWAIMQGIFVSFWIRPYAFDWNLSFIIATTIGLTTGAMLELWFAEIISEFGIGNGVSILIFFNIIANIPKDILVKWIQTTSFDLQTIKTLLIISVIFLLMLVISVLLQESMKKITIISAKQLTEFGNSQDINIYSYIPLKLYQGGIIPIIFASAIISIPGYLMQVNQIGILNNIISTVMPNGIFFLPLYYFLILSFSFLYASLILNPEDISKNLNKTGSSIIGIKPGKATINYLQTILNRLTFLGSLLLFFIAIMPIVISNLNIDILKTVSPTSILILVGVAIQTTKQIQTYILSKEFEELSQDK